MRVKNSMGGKKKKKTPWGPSYRSPPTFLEEVLLSGVPPSPQSKFWKETICFCRKKKKEPF